MRVKRAGMNMMDLRLDLGAGASLALALDAGSPIVDRHRTKSTTARKTTKTVRTKMTKTRVKDHPEVARILKVADVAKAAMDAAALDAAVTAVVLMDEALAQVLITVDHPTTAITGGAAAGAHGLAVALSAMAAVPSTP